MTLEKCFTAIDRYLSRDIDGSIRIVNLENPKDMAEAIARYKVGGNVFLSPADYSAEDERPRISDLFQDLRNRRENVFLTGFTTQWKLEGNETIKARLNTLSHSSVGGHVVLLGYQIEQYLSFADPRLERLVYRVDDIPARKPEIVFVHPDLSIPADGEAVQGIQNIAAAVETTQSEKLYVHTKYKADFYPWALFMISGETNFYDALCRLDASTEIIPIELGTDDFWRFALERMQKYHSWEAVMDAAFGTHSNLEICLKSSQSFDKNLKWLYFIGLKRFGTKNNWCLTRAIEKASSFDDLAHWAMRSCFDLSVTDEDYWARYDSRKATLRQLDVSNDEVLDYCALLQSKERNAIYYLTDLHRREKEMILETLADYADAYTREEISDVLRHVYPDLYAYLLPYNFKNELLNRYFEEYKHCKLTNRITPALEEMAEEQAVKRDYNLILPARTEKLESLNMDRANAWFFDALGVEFLGFIVEKCRQKNLLISVKVCHSELPSITAINKDFLEVFAAHGVQCNSYKTLDGIKHHGEENFKPEITRYPTHLIRELEVIEHILDLIQISLTKGEYDRTIVVSDHGATRMVLLKNKIFETDMHASGIRGGRMCMLTKETTRVDCAVEAGEYYVLANHERFKGGVLTGVEVHGGATLEEVAVPLIEISPVPKQLEIIVTTPEVKIALRKAPVVEFYTTARLEDITVQVDGIACPATITDDHRFSIELPKRIRPGAPHFADVYSGETKVAEGLTFTLVNPGFKSRDIL